MNALLRSALRRSYRKQNKAVGDQQLNLEIDHRASWRNFDLSVLEVIYISPELQVPLDLRSRCLQWSRGARPLKRLLS